MLCSNIAKRRGHTKLNPNFGGYLYHWILQHPQVAQSTIENDCLYVHIDGNYRKILMPKLLFQVYVRELHNSMVSPTK